VQSKQGLF
jgi:hypothetical protein